MKKSAFIIGEFPQSPWSHGKPQLINTSAQTFKVDPLRFKRWGDLSQKVVDKRDISSLLYQDERPVPKLPMDNNNKGL